MKNTLSHPSVKKDKKLLNWLLLFWLCLTYVQYMLATIAELLQTADSQGPTGSMSDIMVPFTSMIDLSRMDSRSIILFTLSAFTLLMALHMSLHCWVLFRTIHQQYVWFYFMFQAVSIWLIYFFVGGNDSTVFGLWLTLAIEAFILLKRLSWIIAVAAICLLFCIAIQGINVFTSLSEGKNMEIIMLAPKLIKTIAEGSLILLFVCASFILYLQQTSAHRRDQELLRELELAHIQLEDYATRVKELTLAAERQRMARELHDTLAQGLVGLTMQLETIDALLVRQRSEQAQTIVQQAMTRSRATISNARAAITDLRTGTPICDTIVAIEKEAEQFTLATGILCTCDLQTQLPANYHDHILRIVSEGLTNIARHAQASQTWIRTSTNHARGILILEIRDNGIGFEPAKVPTGHYGLLGLRERARLMNGQLLMSSLPGQGTAICLSLPLEKVQI